MILDWTKYVKDWQATGSAYICAGMNYTPEDQDYVARGGWLTDWGLKRLGYYPLGNNQQNSYGSMSLVTVYGKQDVDIIVCWSKATYERFVVATQICKWLGVTDKSQRCNIHSIALYGKPM